MASLFPTTPINHPLTLPAQSIPPLIFLCACELCRCAKLTLHLSPALGAQPHFTTNLRSVCSGRCTEPTLHGNDVEKAKLRCYDLRGLPPTGNHRKRNCIFVPKLQYIQGDASITMEAFVTLFIFENDLTDSHPDGVTLDFSHWPQNCMQPC